MLKLLEKKRHLLLMLSMIFLTLSANSNDGVTPIIAASTIENIASLLSNE